MANFGSVLIGIAMLINAIVAVYGLCVASKNAATLKTNAGTIEDLKVATDGKLTQLLKITAESEHAKGVLQGQKEG